jgi:hypothetical protein
MGRRLFGAVLILNRCRPDEFRFATTFLKEAEMKPIQSFTTGLNRRLLLSAFAALPTLIGPLGGRSARAQTDALPNKWTVVNMKNDWKKIFPFQ